MVVLDKRKKTCKRAELHSYKAKTKFTERKNHPIYKEKGLILLYQTFTFLMCVMDKMFHSASFCSVQVFSHWTISLFYKRKKRSQHYMY